MFPAVTFNNRISAKLSSKKGRGREDKTAWDHCYHWWSLNPRGSTRLSVWFVLCHLVCSQWAGGCLLGTAQPFYVSIERKKDGKQLCDQMLNLPPPPPPRAERWRKPALTRGHQAPLPHTWCSQRLCDDGSSLCRHYTDSSVRFCAM